MWRRAELRFMSVETIRWVKNFARIIDQTKLPGQLVYIDCRDVKTMWQAIKCLSVRGAPAIGVAAAFGVLLGVQNFKGRNKSSFLKLFDKTCL
jgi:methylthioribose-1-phosphate isomerase